MNPIIPISSAKFVYTDSARTNIRERFDRIRNEQKQKLIVDNVLAVSVAAWGKNCTITSNREDTKMSLKLMDKAAAVMVKKNEA